MSDTRSILKELKQKLEDHIDLQSVSNTNESLRIDFYVTDEIYHDFLRTAGKDWYKDLERGAKKSFKKELANNRVSKAHEQESIREIIERENPPIIYDAGNEDGIPLTKDNLTLKTESSYREAQKYCRYILAISKDKTGRSTIQPELKFDTVQAKFYIEIPHLFLTSLAQLLKNPPPIKESSWISKQITKAVIPITPDVHYQDIADKPVFTQQFTKYPFINENINVYQNRDQDITLTETPLRLTTQDGVPLDGILIKPAEVSNAYIIHCHGNACFYWDELKDLHPLTALTGCNVIAFDYRGYGLSQGIVTAKEDLFEDAFTYAKHCVDQGAEYVLLDGFSIGGAVASHVANKLATYCKDNDKKVQIELFNAGSFTSTPDMVRGAVKEINIPFIGDLPELKNKTYVGKRSEHGIFRTTLASIVTFIATPFLKLTNWLMKPREEVQKLPKESYEVVSAKGDMVIGTYASMESKLRDQTLEELFVIRNNQDRLREQIRQTRAAIVNLINTIRESNAPNTPKLKSYALDEYTVGEINTLWAENIGLFGLIEKTQASEASFNNLIQQLKMQIALLQREQLSEKQKQTRLMHAPDRRLRAGTKLYKDHEANIKNNAHHFHLMHQKNNNETITAQDKKIAFINTRALRADITSDNFLENVEAAEYDIQIAKKVFEESVKIDHFNDRFSVFSKDPNTIHVKRNDNIPLKIVSLDTLKLECERIQRILPRKAGLVPQLNNIIECAEKGEYEEVAESLKHKCFEGNKILAQFTASATAFIEIAKIANKFGKA